MALAQYLRYVYMRRVWHLPNTRDLCTGDLGGPGPVKDIYLPKICAALANYKRSFYSISVLS